jgi:hypothetical protein
MLLLFWVSFPPRNEARLSILLGDVFTNPEHSRGTANKENTNIGEPPTKLSKLRGDFQNHREG